MISKEHPIIKELFVNEDGSEVIYHGEKLKVRSYGNLKKSNYKQKFVYVVRKLIPLAKLICETFHGMRSDMSLTVQRKDFNPDNYHYENLFWGTRRNQTKKFKRSKISKLNEKDVMDIIQRIKNKESMVAIGKSYGVSDTTIYRIKKRYIADPLKVLKEKVQQAKDTNAVHDVCAQHLGYKTKGHAISKMGAYEFSQETDKILKQLK